MQKQPVVVVLRSRFRDVAFFLVVLFGAASSSSLYAESRYIPVSANQQQKYLAKIELNTAEELSGILDEIEQWSGKQKAINHPIVIILHGPEAKTLLRANYSSNQSIVDLAQSLEEKEVVRIRVCKTWMLFNDYTKSDFAPFIDTIPYAPSEIKRLMTEDGYTYF